MYHRKSKNIVFEKSLCFLNFHNLFKFFNNKLNNILFYLFFINTLFTLNVFIKSTNFTFLNFKKSKNVFFNNKKNFKAHRFNVFNVLNFFLYFMFHVFKKNIYALFRLNLVLPLNKITPSFKNVISNFLNFSFIEAKVSKPWLSDVSVFLKKNKLKTFAYVTKLKNRITHQKLLFLSIFSIKSFYSFYLLWNFVLFTPSLNFFFLNSNSSNIFNSSLNVWENFFKNKVSIYKYLNISNLGYLNLSYTKLLKFKKLKYKVLKFIEDSLFSDVLIRLTESVTGGKTLVSVNKSLKEQLSVYEWTKLDVLKRRLQNSMQSKFWRLNTRFLHSKTKSFRNFYKRGFSFFWYEITLVCFLTYKSKDTSLLMTYIKKKMRFMNLFSHKFFLKKLWLVLKLLFIETKSMYVVHGIKIKVSGKLSVTGNSRTRTKIFKEGIISYSNMTTKADYSFNIIKTKTGCLGFSLWLFF